MWLNLDDCYASGETGRTDAATHYPSLASGQSRRADRRASQRTGVPTKNLLGVPWRVALALQADRWWIRNAIVWSKINPAPESVRDRLSRTYELLFLLTRSSKYHFDLDAIRVPVKHLDARGRDTLISGTGTGPRDPIGSAARRHSHNANGPAKYQQPDPALFAGHLPGTAMLAGHAHASAHPRGKNPGDVWRLPTRPLKEAHFAAYPIDIPLQCIAAGCRHGGTVLDMFSGAGTTGRAALQLGRRYIGIELNPEYTAITQRRLLQYLDASTDTASGSRASGGQGRKYVPQSPPRPAIVPSDRRLDPSAPPVVDRHPQPARPGTTHPGTGATDPRPHRDRETGRTSDPCPPYPQPTPGSTPDATGPQRPADHDTPHPSADPNATAGPR